jgi:hypothetical protein
VDVNSIRKLLEQVKSSELDVDQALDELKTLPYEDLGFAHVDHHRALRTGYPEVILGSDKTADQIVQIIERILAKGANILATRIDAEKAGEVTKLLPNVTYNPVSRTITHINEKTVPAKPHGMILIVTAGTSDIPVAEEAVITAELMGNRVETLYDVGVAGIHRLLSKSDLLHKASVIVVVAGMEGALASVVGGLTDKPVIAVPTSVGYGASFGGLSALLGMLNSCSPGVAVVNIDNGFGAAFMAGMINRNSCEKG